MLTARHRRKESTRTSSVCLPLPQQWSPQSRLTQDGETRTLAPTWHSVVNLRENGPCRIATIRWILSRRIGGSQGNRRMLSIRGLVDGHHHWSTRELKCFNTLHTLLGLYSVYWETDSLSCTPAHSFAFLIEREIRRW